MSILIKGMEMPVCCVECLACAFPRPSLLINPVVHCSITDRTIGLDLAQKHRQITCPLIELPDHGDLIEKGPLLKKAEELEEQARAEFERYKLGETNWEQTEKAKWRIAHLERIGFKHDIADAPVIIPAERRHQWKSI